MSEPEATPAGDLPVPADAPAAPAFDASLIRGLQVFASAEAAAEGVDDAARKEGLAQLLTARATRLAEAVDDALTLANDGAIRWLGDPVGKLIAGAASLEPRAALLADEALPQEGREAAERRLSLWLAAALHKALGPLIALADAQGAPEAARAVGQKVSQAFGVLERERVKAEVKALDQEARGALRKLGVRFGAHYIYVPVLLKPGARALCAQLWALTQSHIEPDAVERLLHFAASGRTSFAVEPPASSELCRIAGFRLCGDRAVRVDIVERLSDLIRAAMPRAPSPEPVDEADGFVVTGQMTSLTGCSGEPFASILRSLGFVAHQVKKSAHLAAIARRAAALAAAAAPAAETAPSGEAGNALAAGAEAAMPVEAQLAAPVEAESAPAIETEAASPLEAETPAPCPEPAAVEVEPPVEPSPFVDAAPSPEPQSEDGRLQEPQDKAVETSVEAAAAREPESIAKAEPAEAAPQPAAESAAAEVEGPPPAVEAPVAESAPAPAEDETIEVWRPAPRRPRHQHHRQQQHHRHRPSHGPRPEGAAEGQSERPAGQEARGGRPWRNRQAGSGENPRPAADARQEGRQGDGRRGPPPWRRDGAAKGDRREDSGGERRPEESKRPEKGKPRPQPTESRKPAVDLDSPFAKLLELKPLLQGRDKNR